MAEHRLCKAGVGGSIPLVSTALTGSACLADTTERVMSGVATPLMAHSVEISIERPVVPLAQREGHFDQPHVRVGVNAPFY